MNLRKLSGVFFVISVVFSLFFASCSSSSIDFEAKTAESLLAGMTTEEKVAQLFVLRLEQLELNTLPEDRKGKSYLKLTSEFKSVLKKYPVGGFCLFANNIKGKKQLKKLNKDLRMACEIPPIIAVDEEGGRVARLARTESLGIENVGFMADIGASGDAQNALKAGAYIGKYLSEYGFTVDFAPVVDVNTNPENIVIGQRAFGSEPELVSEMAGAFLAGLHSAGIRGCIKHFPGHGDTKGDTHADYVAVEKSWEELKACELIPFKANFEQADMVMIAHVTLTKAASDGLPASLSKELITDKLRGELGYKGIVLTDALDMGAIEKNYGSANAAVLAFEAGNDILLIPYDFVPAYEGMLEAVKSGKISEERLDESVLRILNLKGF